jgi:integrase
MNRVRMNASPSDGGNRRSRFDWRGDLARSRDLTQREIDSYVVDKEKVAFATQKQALNALVFFYRDVCGREEVDLQVRMRRTTPRQPVILNRTELMGMIGKLEDRYRTAALLQYGAGLRLKELVGLRLKDVDLERGVVTVRSGKGDKDRETVIPNSLKVALSQKVDESLGYWEADRQKGVPGVALPGALARKMSRCGEKPGWHWLFCAEELSKDPESGVIRRHHLHPKVTTETVVDSADRRC